MKNVRTLPEREFIEIYNKGLLGKVATNADLKYI